jgi:hypothetical protein
MIYVILIFRFGSPGSVAQEYVHFATFYVKTFSTGVIEIVLRILDQYRNKVYVPPRVMQMGLNYLNQWYELFFLCFLLNIKIVIIANVIMCINCLYFVYAFFQGVPL